MSRKLRLAALSTPLVLLAACGPGHQRLTQDALDPQGPVARKLDNLINPVFLIAALVFILVEGLVLYISIRFRRRSDEDRPRQVHGSTRLEIGWTIIPAVLLGVVGIATIGTIFQINRQPKGDVLNVTVTGHQWWWEYDYPGMKVTTANELHIPVGRPVYLALKSDDVIHNYWPPKLAGKVYAIPGRTNHMVVQADKPGTFYGECAEFCGLSHANMRLRVVAHTPEDFARWTAANNSADPIEQPTAETGASEDAVAGAALFRQKGCSSCHSVAGYSAGEVGPNLTHLQQRAVFAGAIFPMNDNNLRKWLRNPPKEKPGSIMPNLNLSEDEITKLIAYLDDLK